MHKPIETTDKAVVDLSPSAPFSFEGTFHKPSHFPTPDQNYDNGEYSQSIRFQDQTYGLQFSNRGTVSDPRIVLCAYYDAAHQDRPDMDALAREIEYRYDLKSDLQTFNSRFESDSILGPAVERWRGMRVSSAYSLYEFTAVTTVLQNTVVRRSVQMMENLFKTYGRIVKFSGKELFAFWTPNDIDAVEEEDLRGLKVGYRAKILKRQAAAFVSGKINPPLWRELDKESLKKELLKIYGIGPATVQYILFEVFHHYDAFEYIPPWEQKIFSRLLFERDLVDADTILNEVNRRYGSWKMLAAHYIFENIFWLRRHESIPWLDALIRL